MPGISMELGLKRVNNNSRLYRELLIRFLDTKCETGNEIRAGLEQGDTKAAKGIAHSMRSIAGVIGAEELSNAAAVLESAIAAGDREKRENTLEMFEQCLGVVIAGLEAGLGRGTEQEAPSGEHPVNQKVVQGIVEEMAGLLNNDLGRAMRLRDELRGHLAGSNFAREYEQLERQLEVFDIDGAKESLEQLATALGTAGEEKNG